MRFADVSPPVKVYSRCTRPTNYWGFVRDKDTGEMGLIFVISAVQCPTSTRCEVEGGYYEWSESASGNLFIVEKEATGWIVVDDQLRWIS
jgi:hypothetical protein